jgi:hypothetical protein
MVTEKRIMLITVEKVSVPVKLRFCASGWILSLLFTPILPRVNPTVTRVLFIGEPVLPLRT